MCFACRFPTSDRAFPAPARHWRTAALFGDSNGNAHKRKSAAHTRNRKPGQLFSQICRRLADATSAQAVGAPPDREENPLPDLGTPTVRRQDPAGYRHLPLGDRGHGSRKRERCTWRQGSVEMSGIDGTEALSLFCAGAGALCALSPGPQSSRR